MRDHPAGTWPRWWPVAVATLLGTVVLVWSFATTPGSATFLISSALLGVVWIGGAMVTGGRGALRLTTRSWRPTAVLGVGAGAGLALVFAAGAVVVRQIDLLSGPVAAVADYVERGNGWTVVAVALIAGVGEELFFRGAVFTAVQRHSAGNRWTPAVVSWFLYTAVTATTGNVMLTFAAALLGLVTAWERHVFGGVAAPVATHVVWSLGMLFLLPWAFA